MGKIRVSTVIEASPEQVWDYVKDISSHVEWMADAESIDFHGEQTSGIGTTFACVTKVGPIRLTDEMEITQWSDNEAMGVAHTGIVTGVGLFTLTPAGPGRTEFRWEEELHFPKWMGGPLRNPVGDRILTLIWRRNLKRLKKTVESDA